MKSNPFLTWLKNQSENVLEWKIRNFMKNVDRIWPGSFTVSHYFLSWYFQLWSNFKNSPHNSVLYRNLNLFLVICIFTVFVKLGSTVEFSTRFYGLFYWKNEVSEETTFIFILWCGTVSRENWMKLAVLFYCFYWLKKWNWLMVSWMKLA